MLSWSLGFCEEHSLLFLEEQSTFKFKTKRIVALNPLIPDINAELVALLYLNKYEMSWQ